MRDDAVGGCAALLLMAAVIALVVWLGESQKRETARACREEFATRRTAADSLAHLLAHRECFNALIPPTRADAHA